MYNSDGTRDNTPGSMGMSNDFSLYEDISKQIKKSGHGKTVGEWVCAPTLRAFVYPGGKLSLSDDFVRPTTKKQAQAQEKEQRDVYNKFEKYIRPKINDIYYPGDFADPLVTWGYCAFSRFAHCAHVHLCPPPHSHA